MAAILCAGLLVLPLVSLRNHDEPTGATMLSLRARPADAGEADRAAPRRASRSDAARAPVTAVPTTQAPVTTTTVAPPVTVSAQAAPSTTEAPPPTTAKPRPATTSTAPPPTTAKPPPERDGSGSTGTSGNTQSGKASFYRAGYHAENPHHCAHKTLPKGTVVRVTHTGNGRSTSCTVMDRGPYVEGRIIDLSEQTFAQLAPPSDGVIPVRIDW